MATLIHSINATINGSCSHADVVADAEHHAYAADLLASAEALLFGRTTFDLFAGFWPQAASSRELPAHIVAFGRQLGDARKYVMSGRELVTDWSNTFRLAGSLEAEVANLRRRIGGKLVIFGSPGLAASLAGANQIDEYHVLVQPFIAHASPRLFESVTGRRRLHLTSAVPLASGVVLLKYRPEGHRLDART